MNAAHARHFPGGQLCGEVCGDKYSAQWSVQAFGGHGIKYRQAELTASEIYLYCEALFARAVTVGASFGVVKVQE